MKVLVTYVSRTGNTKKVAQAIFDQIQVHLAEKVYFIPIVNRLGVWGVREGIQNIKPAWFSDIFWNVQEWDITQ